MAQMFLRRTSGLVRTVSGRDVFIYNVVLINMGIGLGTILLLGPAFYPGASLWLGTTIVTILCIVQALTYYGLSTTMPRTGGEYVFISRLLHPSLGIAMSVSMVIWLMFNGTCWSAYMFANMGLAPIFADLGNYFHSATLASWSTNLTGDMGGLGVGIVMIVASAALLIWGTDKFFKVQIWTFAVAMIGLIAMAVVLAVSSRADFVAQFNATAVGIAGPDRYQTVIDTARDTGWSNPGFNWASTLKFMVWPFFPLAYAIMSCSFAGEIKKVERSQLAGMAGAVAVCGAIMVLLIFLAQRVIGYDFLGAIGWNTYMAPEASTATVPWIQLLVATLTSNLAVKLVIGIGFLMWTYFWISGCMFYCTRAIFSWSFDRLFPKTLADVSPRYHTPVKSIALVAGIAVAFLFMYSLTDLLKTLLGIFAMTFTFFFIGISAMVLPYRRRELFESSPMNYRLFGLPLISILGFVTTVFMGYMIYLFLGDEIAGGSSIPSLIGVFVPMTLAFLSYFVVRRIRKRQGIDVSLVYKEIPVE